MLYQAAHDVCKQSLRDRAKIIGGQSKFNLGLAHALVLQSIVPPRRKAYCSKSMP